ncbi:uncharacterized protein LOC108089686 [Drosophila ficusphila]|uniref:uncharacterized protein LOC108089686 n=1 Tax=Drosophila ficusphila TaxID=30025 RepID=UPI0007E84ECB|nr:uncharacterized protein LOC108089686 [Drosophila ficusphila]
MCRLLVFLIIIPCVGRSLSWTAGDVVHQLNKDLRLQLNIYLDCEDMEFQLNQEVPNLLVNTSVEQRKLLGRFNERALIIACLKDSTDNRTLSGLKDLLWGLQKLHILYVVNSNVHLYFEEALNNGFLHVLALNSKTGSLYTYEPYPEIKIHQVEKMQSFYTLTRLRNLQGHTVYITVETMTPRCFRYNNSNGERVYAGYMYKMIKTFIEFYNGTEEHVFANYSYVPYAIGLRALKNGQIDMLPRIIHAMDWIYFYRSHVLYNIKTFIMVPWAEPLPKSLYFIRPFDWTVWMAFTISIAYSSIMIWWMGYRQKGKSSLSLTFMDVLQMMFQLPFTKIWHFKMGTRQVFNFFVLFASGFVLTNLYTAQLSCYLTTGLFKHQLNSFEDLFREKQLLMVDQFDADVLRNMTKSKIIQQGFDNIILTDELNTVLKHRNNLNTLYAYEAYEDRLAYLLLQQKYLRVPLFKTINEVFDQQPVFVALRHGLPYTELVNDYIRRIWESGIWVQLQKEANLEGIANGKISYRKSKSREVQVFDRKFYFFAYFLLGLGWLFGIVLFLLERFIYHIKYSK